MSDTTPPLRSFASIVDADGTSGWKAEEFLRVISELTVDDLAVPALLVAAQVYAQLEVAAQLETIKDVLANA